MNFLDGCLEHERNGLVFVSDTLRIALATERRPVAALKSGDVVTLGVRPEDLVLADAPESAAISGQLVLAEVLGATTHLHVEVEGRRLVAAVPSGPAPGAVVGLSVDPQRLHLFAADGSSLLEDRSNP
jgi:ABC-type sugar transport system ATPase subunit